jgi:hypothetical protein
MRIQFFLSFEGFYSDRVVLNVSNCWNEYKFGCWLVPAIL